MCVGVGEYEHMSSDVVHQSRISWTRILYTVKHLVDAHLVYSAAPYVNVTIGNTRYKQYTLVNFFSDVIQSQIISTLDDPVAAALFYFFPQDDGTYRSSGKFELDLASCVTDSPCGLPVLANGTFPTYYLLNECGKTIELTADISKSQYVVVYSHPGFGCKAFPDGPSYDCTVTFTSTSLYFTFTGAHFKGAAAACDGYMLRATYGTTLDADMCSDGVSGSGNTTFTLRGQALAKTFKAGFFFLFTK
ncbi:uncharacterized protein LOC108682722 [Hyalella azteca]|uniref:Uncharacterized protein LOC108682722 n=1 Tax=Hyalella azteca TaxID=294128 RepID=A0A8B7PMN6_HYAAZ|nr:uncharacterized protein LOC108682722 [Hyalella azteca]